MAAFNKFQNFVEDLGKAIHNLDTGLLKVYLSNTAPNGATHLIKSDIAEITAGFGYAAGGTDVAGVYTEAGGVGTLSSTDVTFLAVGGSIGPFRYAILYNDTPTAPVDPLIGWWDYGSSITLGDGESFTVDFGASILTIT